jgi:Pterin binding enzyme
MSAGEPPTTISAGQETPGGVSVPCVRVFSLATSSDLADELQSLEVGHGASLARRQLQVAVKLLVPSHWQPSVARLVASLPGLTLYTQTRLRREAALLIIGQMQAIEACAHAMASAALPTAPLALEMLTQLEHVAPRPYHTFACGGRSLDFSVKTGIMGILNITPDSFYDGGRYVDPQAAVDRAHQMVAEGADIIDIRGQSSRPGSHPVSEAEEETRVLPVVKAVARSAPALISVDTYRGGIARATLDAGAHLINDISALRFDPALLGVVAAYHAPLILMHMQGMPRNMQLSPSYDALIDEVFAFLHERLEAAQVGGMPAERLLLDPGIGFGKGT